MEWLSERRRWAGNESCRLGLGEEERRGGSTWEDESARFYLGEEVNGGRSEQRTGSRSSGFGACRHSKRAEAASAGADWLDILDFGVCT